MAPPLVEKLPNVEVFQTSRLASFWPRLLEIIRFGTTNPTKPSRLSGAIFV